MEQKLFILCGLPFAGKTYAAEIIKRNVKDIISINFDDLRKRQKRRLTDDEIWKNVKSQAIKLLRNGLASKKSVVWDSTNPLRKYREELFGVAKEYGVTPVLVY